METYVVRLYRRPDKESQELLGMVEIVEDRDNKAFTTMNELVAIISAAPQFALKPRPVSKGRRHDD